MSHKLSHLEIRTPENVCILKLGMPIQILFLNIGKLRPRVAITFKKSQASSLVHILMTERRTEKREFTYWKCIVCSLPASLPACLLIS